MTKRKLVLTKSYGLGFSTTVPQDLRKAFAEDPEVVKAVENQDQYALWVRLDELEDEHGWKPYQQKVENLRVVTLDPENKYVLRVDDGSEYLENQKDVTFV